ncbi:MAG TPA: efflux RND transporter periplasmic adaptor subunit [Candidatus Limnocylindria bacterium]|jgi:HlyD family secretion protein|nr:efflux RND transporter periplasmic adaptor subunit [Candidatus Limnocylindria bacterium]
MKALFTTLIAAALVAGGWFAWQKRAANQAPVQESHANIAAVETRSIKFAVNAAGDIGPAEQVSVRPEVNGKIEMMTVDVGDSVKSNSILFKLEDTLLQTQKQQDEKNVERSKLELEQAERDYVRSQKLWDEKLISLEVFEDTRTKFDLAKNDIARSQKVLDLDLEQLKKTIVRAPFDCTILTRPISVGQAVSGSGGYNAGTEVLTIANLNDLIISAHVNQADITRLKLAQEVDVTVEAVAGLSIKGRVQRIAPQSTVKNNIRGFEVRILLKDVNRQVRPGMTANIVIPVESADNVLAAPLAAIFTETNPDTRQIERFAFVRKDGEWERRKIEIGVSDYSYVEVTKGLQSGDEISLEDKSKVAKSANGPALASNGKPPGIPAAGGSNSLKPATSRPATSPTR